MLTEANLFKHIIFSFNHSQLIRKILIAKPCWQVSESPSSFLIYLVYIFYFHNFFNFENKFKTKILYAVPYNNHRGGNWENVKCYSE